MNKKFLTIATILILALGIAGAAFAATSGGTSSATTNNQWRSPLQDLNLTDDQLSKLRELRTDFFNKTQEIRNELQKKMFELSNLYLSNNPDQTQIEAKRAEIENLQNKLYEMRKQSSQELSSILTKEQLAQIAGDRLLGMGMGFGRGRHRGWCGWGCPLRPSQLPASAQ
ncbi:MAG: Spy/CpxP family protein refolding chaperone [Thermacetogeniaceae bacterium]